MPHYYSLYPLLLLFAINLQISQVYTAISPLFSNQSVENSEFFDYFSQSSQSLNPPLTLSLVQHQNSVRFQYKEESESENHGQNHANNGYSTYLKTLKKRGKREINNSRQFFGHKSNEVDVEDLEGVRVPDPEFLKGKNFSMTNEDKLLYALLTSGAANYHYDPKTTKYSSYSSNKRSANKRDIYIAGFFPTSQNISEGRVGRGVLPAVQLALHYINQNKDILKDYVLHISWNNTKCDAAEGMKAFFDSMHDKPNKLMLFGDACTQVTDPIAKASKHWKIVQLSYADMHPMYSATNYPNLFRIVPSENEFNAPRVELMKVFNWTRVATFYQNQPRYSLAHNKLVSELEEAGIEVVATLSFADDVHSQMNLLKEQDVRIILGNFNETWARRIFCEAYRQNMFGRRYEWIIVGTYNQQWWRAVGPDDKCTLNEIESALKGALIMDLLPLSSAQEIVTISGKTPAEYQYFYDVVRLGEYSRFHGYAYDGIWAIALALDNLGKFYFANTSTGPSNYPSDLLVKYRYHDERWEKAFLMALEATNFNGVTGPVRFRDNGRKGTVLIKQFQTFHWNEDNGVNAEVKIGEYDGVTQTLYLNKGQTIVWNGPSPPKDRTFKIIEHTRVNVPLFAGLAIISTIGIVLASFFLGVNIKFRNQRYIKMSSPYLNNLIIIGCMLAYLSVIILGLDSRLTSTNAFPYICTARAWVLMSGFTLAFGSMFSKTWRVHSIFTNIKMNKKVIKDMQLFIVVGILLALDFAILTTWQILDPFYRETKLMEGYVDASNDDIEIIPEIEYCKSYYMSVFVGCIYAYKGILMIFGCFLAWETRHVSIPALNDSKYIGMSVYNSVMMCVIGAPLSHVLSDKQDANFAIISLFIIFCTTSSLCLVFLPKVIELKRNPKGIVEKKNLRATMKPTFGLATGGGGTGSATGHPGGSVTGTGAGYCYTGGGGGSSTGHGTGGTVQFAGRRSSGSLHETEMKQAKQANQAMRRKIREIDKEIQAIAKLLSKDDDKEVQALLKEVMAMITSGSGQNLLIPQDKLLKKEDTDISSLYSLNSEGGDEVIIVDNNNDNCKDNGNNGEKKIEDLIVIDHLAESKGQSIKDSGISVIGLGDEGQSTETGASMRKHMEHNFYVNNANVNGDHNKLTQKSPISGQGGIMKGTNNNTNANNIINKNLMAQSETSSEKDALGTPPIPIPGTQHSTSFFYYYYPPPPTISNAEVVEDEDSQPYIAIEEKFISPPSITSSTTSRDSGPPSSGSVVRELANATLSAVCSIPVGPGIQTQKFDNQISVRPTTLLPTAFAHGGIGIGTGPSLLVQPTTKQQQQQPDRRFSLAIETFGKNLNTSGSGSTSESGLVDRRRMSYDPSSISLGSSGQTGQQTVRKLSMQKEVTRQEANVLEEPSEDKEEDEEYLVESEFLELEESSCDELERKSPSPPKPPPPPPRKTIIPPPLNLNLVSNNNSKPLTTTTTTAAAETLQTLNAAATKLDTISSTYPVMYASCSALNEFRPGGSTMSISGSGRGCKLAQSGEIPLDVSLLPIFHRLWSDRRSTSTNIVDICDQDEDDEELLRAVGEQDDDDDVELTGELGRKERLRKKGRLIRIDGYPGGGDRQLMTIRRTASVVPGTGYKLPSRGSQKGRGGTGGGAGDRKRFMVSCPNLLEIKCDIVEYL